MINQASARDVFVATARHIFATITPGARQRVVGAELRKAYLEGMRQGLRSYAYWKDGVQHVGCGNKTLKQALDELDEHESPWKGLKL